MSVLKKRKEIQKELYARRNQGYFVPQRTGKKFANISAGQLRNMFPAEPVTMNDAQVLAAKDRLLKSRQS